MMKILSYQLLSWCFLAHVLKDNMNISQFIIKTGAIKNHTTFMTTSYQWGKAFSRVLLENGEPPMSARIRSS